MSKQLPSGVLNIKAKIKTNPEEKNKVVSNHFEDRMRKRPVVEDVKEILDMKADLFKDRLKEAVKTKSEPYNINELDKVRKSLKTGKSKDPDGYICELFKEGSIGTDLKNSIPMLMNKLKAEMNVPECLRMAHITILHKKNSKLDLKNWRGIFVCSVIRTILMK